MPNTQRFKMPERLDFVSSPDTEMRLTKMLSSEPDVLECDFSETTYVSSAGLRILLLVAKKISVYGGTLRLVNVTKYVQRAFQVANLGSIVDIETTATD